MARRKANKNQSPAKATPRSVALSQTKGYVAAQAAEGYAHSQGTFTVDESLAAQKLGRYQLAKDGSWILALIQVACRGGASEIRVKIGATRTVVTLRNSRPWSWDELQPAVYQGQALQGEFELSLALVLRFLVARGQEGYGNHVHTPMGESLSLPFGAVHRASPGLGGRFRPGDATFELDTPITTGAAWPNGTSSSTPTWRSCPSAPSPRLALEQAETGPAQSPVAMASRKRGSSALQILSRGSCSTAVASTARNTPGAFSRLE